MIKGLTLKLFFIALVAFISTDVIWLRFVAKNLYFQHYGHWLNIANGQLKILWWAAGFVYLLFALGVTVFILPLAHNSPCWAAFYGAVLGAIIYGVYDCTCLAIFKNFPIAMGLLDWLWGIVLYSWSSFLTVYFGTHLK